jgi:hypothetical protein
MGAVTLDAHGRSGQVLRRTVTVMTQAIMPLRTRPDTKTCLVMSCSTVQKVNSTAVCQRNKNICRGKHKQKSYPMN